MSFTSGGSRWSDVYLATAARGISVAGDFLAATALAITLQSAGARGMAVAGLLLAGTLPLVALAPLAGRLADRVDSRTLLVGAGLFQAAICAALTYAGDPWLIIALVALLACGLAVTQPTLAALVPEMVGSEDLPRASALNQTASTLGVLVGPMLAGLLVGEFGARVPLLIDSASYLAIVAAGLLLRTRRGGRIWPAGPPAADDAPPPPAVWRMRRDPLIWAMVGSVAATIAGVGAINVIELYFVRETLHAPATVYGVIISGWTAGVLPGTWLLARAAPRMRDDAALVQAMLVMLGCCCLMVLAGAVVPAAEWLVPLWLIGGVANGGVNVFSNLVVAHRVPPSLRGRAFATMGAAVQGASMAGYLVGGVLLEYVPPRPLVALSGGAGLVLVGVFVLPIWRAARDERTTRRAGSATLPPTRCASAMAGRYRGDHERECTPATPGRAHPVS